MKRILFFFVLVYFLCGCSATQANMCKGLSLESGSTHESEITIFERVVPVTVNNNLSGTICYSRDALEQRLEYLNELSKANLVGHVFENYISIVITIEHDPSNPISGIQSIEGQSAVIHLNMWAIEEEITQTGLNLSKNQNLEAILMDELANLASNLGPTMEQIGVHTNTQGLNQWQVGEVFSWGVYIADISILANNHIPQYEPEIYHTVFVQSLGMRPLNSHYVGNRYQLGFQLSEDEFKELFRSYSENSYIISVQD